MSVARKFSACPAARGYIPKGSGICFVKYAARARCKRSVWSFACAVLLFFLTLADLQRDQQLRSKTAIRQRESHCVPTAERRRDTGLDWDIGKVACRDKPSVVRRMHPAQK